MSAAAVHTLKVVPDPRHNGRELAIMAPVLPSWFKQRQCKAEEAGANQYRLTGPNLPEAFIRIEKADGGYRAVLRRAADGPDVLVSQQPLPTEYEAWGTAFEFYRGEVLV